ncbi:UNVERIFIED_CONTAM: hypothetical protein Sindi_0467300, partial [Sesamum indicum]
NFLGLQIVESAHDTSITLAKYILDIITDCGLQQALSAATPLTQGMKLHSHTDAYLNGPKPYPRSVRRLLYFSFTRPDISECIQQPSQFLQNSYEAHWHAVLHVVCYFKGSPTKDFLFPSYLVTYCVADWRSCVGSHHFLSRFCIFFGDALVSWKMKKQCTVSRSSAEAEYHSMGPTICKFKWISYILCDFGTVVLRPFLCIAISDRLTYHGQQ